VENANSELGEAAKMQKHNRIMKIRLGVTGIFGAIGMKIFGIPGLIAGLFTGFAATK